MPGLMMQTPLLLSSVLMHAARSFPDVEIVSRTPEKPDHITSYSGLLRRSSQLANFLDSIGIKPGDRVATLAWNSYRHLELYFGISGMGPFVTRSIQGCSWSRSYTSSTTPKMWLCSSIWLSSIS
jgi:fatty-acyl-CoA synthase